MLKMTSAAQHGGPVVTSGIGTLRVFSDAIRNGSADVPLANGTFVGDACSRNVKPLQKS